MITLEDLEQLSTGGRSVSTFDFVQTVGEKDTREALRLLGKVLEGGQPLEVLGVILWNFRLLCRALEWVDQGFSPSEALIKAKIPPFAAKKLIKQMDRFRSAEMPRLFDLFLAADLDIKGDSSLPPARVLEKLVWQVCGVK
jgi:DNA polymerase III delta subunit